MNLHYLGPAKTFSEQAAQSLIGSDESFQLIAEPSFEAIAKSVTGPTPTRGVLPYYNFLEGLIQESLDLVYEYQLHIIGYKRVAIELSIGGCGAALASDAVFSHPKALAQCSEFIQEHLPHAQQIPVSSTAEAARRVKETGAGLAIANRNALAEFELKTLHEDIGNRKQGRANFTDFLLVASERVAAPSTAPAPRTILAITPWGDRIGLLADILSCLHFFGLNIAKIHSRPAIDAIEVEVEPQMFYLELFCAADDDRFRHCLDTLTFRFHTVEGAGIHLRVLGSFSVG